MGKIEVRRSVKHRAMLEGSSFRSDASKKALGLRTFAVREAEVSPVEIAAVWLHKAADSVVSADKPQEGRALPQ